MTLPDVYVVGAPKCGTTSIARWLDSHDDVYVSVPKEPYYWASDYPRMRRHYGFDTRVAYENLYRSEAAQRAVHRVDASTTYLYSAVAVPDILQAVPNARFVVALRNPVNLVVSYHRTQLVALNEDDPDLASAWARSLAGGQPRTDPLDAKLLDYASVGRLGAAVARLLGEVPRDRLHIATLEELAQEPSAAWTRLTEFLQISGEPVPDFAVHNASDKMYRWPFLRRLTHRPPRYLEPPVRVLRQFSRTTSVPAVAIAKRRMWRTESRPSISDDLRRQLVDYFAEDMELLHHTVGVDLSAQR